MLVIDPKSEIGDALESTAGRERLSREIVRLRPGNDNWLVWLFEGLEPLDLSGGDIVQRILSVSSAYAYQRANTREAYFLLQAERALREMVEVDLALYRRGGAEWVIAFWEEVARRIHKQERTEIPADVFLSRHLALLSLAARGSTRAIDSYAEVGEAHGVPGSIMAPVSTIAHLAQETFTSVISTLLGMTSDVAHDRFQRHVWYDPFVHPPEERRRIRFKRASRHSPGARGNWCVTSTVA